MKVVGRDRKDKGTDRERERGKEESCCEEEKDGWQGVKGEGRRREVGRWKGRK